MVSEWCKYRIGDLGKVVTGKTPSTKMKKYFDGPYPFITIPDMGSSVYISETERTLSESGAEVMKSCRIPKDSVMMSCIATIGKCGITTKDSFTNQQINSVICGNEIVYPRYLYYVFTQLSNELDAAGGGGSVYTNVSKTRFSNISVNLPPLHEQRAISHILGSLDDKIELNRRMNETLEAMARAIFKSWFVDFDPVRENMKRKDAKAQGREDYVNDAIPASSRPGVSALPSEILDLFPDSFEESEIGEVPSGWEVDVLENVCKRITDGSHYSPKSIDNGYPMASVKDMHTWGINIESCRQISQDEFEKLVHNDCKPLKNDVLIAKDGSYLKHIFVVNREIDLVILSSIAILRPNERINPYILSYILKDDGVMSRMRNYVSGAVLQRIILKDFRKFRIILPPIELQNIWYSYTKNMFEMVWNKLDEINTLISLRDTLLPKLISGELRVANAEELLKEHAL